MDKMIFCLLALSSLPVLAEMKVNTNFLGSSGDIVFLDGKAQRISLNPTKCPNRGWRCWWYVRVTGIRAGEVLGLEVGDAPWATPNHASFSMDRGETWQQTSRGKRCKNRMEYHFKVDSDSVLVA